MNRKLSSYHADLIKALANPGRLMVLQELRGGKKTASELVKSCSLSKANLSQHLDLLKKEGLVLCVKRGTFCYYSLADRRIVRALDLLEQVLHDRAR